MKDEFLTEHINIRVTPKERIQIQEQAEISGLTVSEYSRRRISGCYIPSKIERGMLYELRRQGGLLKHLFNEAQGMYSENFSDALNSVNLFIKKLEEIIFNDK